MRRLIAALASFAFLSCPVLADELEGRYTIRGSNPGGSGGYSGTVSIQKTGETYQVTWQVGNTRFVGTALGSAQGLAVTYRAGDNTGVAIYTPSAQGGFDGFWTYAGGRQVGTERWIR